MKNWGGTRHFGRFEQQLGSFEPIFKLRYELGTVVRALMKLGINVLAAVCERTTIDYSHFGQAVETVLDPRRVNMQLICENGFVRAADVHCLRDESDGHTIQLFHFDGIWRFYFAFFGGRAGAYAQFPGPSRENWTSARIVAPLNSKKWSIETSSLFLGPYGHRIAWGDHRAMVPSFELHNQKCAITSRRSPAKTRGAKP
jgi:hypothetical protein